MTGPGVGGSLSWALRAVAATTADEAGIGPVWAPAEVEWVELEASAGNVAVRMWAVFGRQRIRTGLTQDQVVFGDLLTPVMSSQALEGVRSGWFLEVAGDRHIAVGRVVPWAPWWLLARVENYGAAPASVSGRLRLRVFDGVEQILPVERSVRGVLADPRLHVWGLNPGARSLVGSEAGGGYSLPGIPGGRVVVPSQVGFGRSVRSP